MSKLGNRYKIQARTKAGAWALDLVGEPNGFASATEAQSAIEALQAEGYADTEMRVVRVDPDGLTPLA